MIRSTRKITLLLLVILLINLIGFYAYFFVRLHEIHESSRAALRHLPKDALTHFIFTAAEFENVKIEEHEIQVNGNMYDIAITEISSGKIHVYARHDAAEDNLLAFVHAIVNRIDQDTKNPGISFIQYLNLTFTAPELVSIPAHASAEIVNQLVYHAAPYQVFLKGIFHPPSYQLNATAVF